MGQRLLDKIRYFTNDHDTSVQARVELRFVWTARNDAVSSARQGELVYLEKRLARIEVWLEHGTVHTYNILFQYVPDKFDMNSLLLGAVEVRSPDGLVRRVLRRFGYAPALAAFGPEADIEEIPDQAEEIPPQSTYGLGDRGVRIADVNGDGYSDIIQNLGRVLFGSQITPGLFVHDHTSPYNLALDALAGTTNQCFVDLGGGGPCGWTVSDYNGDTRPDLLYLPTTITSAPIDTPRFLYNDGLTWHDAPAAVQDTLTAHHTARDSYTDLPTPSWTTITNAPIQNGLMDGGAIRDAGIRLADVNGDGLQDIVQVYYYFYPGDGEADPPILEAYHRRVGVWLQTTDADGNILGWSISTDPARTAALEALASDPTHPVYLATNNGTLGFHFTDVNGDGLADLVRLAHNAQRVLLNTGSGWRDAPGFSGSANTLGIYTAGTLTPGGPQIPGVPGTTTPHPSYDTGLVPLDYNNDGLLDYIQSAWGQAVVNPPLDPLHVHAWVNRGDHWEADPQMTAAILGGGIAFADYTFHASTGWLLGDFDGDLRTDLLRLSSFISRRMGLRLALGQIPRLLAREVNELGGMQELQFTTPAIGLVNGWSLQSASGMYSVPAVPVAFVQARVQCAVTSGDDPDCAPGTRTARELTNFRYHDAFIGARGIRLFGRVDATNSVSSIPADLTRIERIFDLTPACRNEFKTLRRYRSGGFTADFIAREDRQLTSTVVMDSVRSRCNINYLESDTRDVGATQTQRRVEFESDDYGNITRIRDLGFVDDPSDGFERQMVYANPTDGRALSLPYIEEEYKLSGALLSTRRTRYDGLPVGTVGAGAVSAIDALVSAGVWATETIVTDSLGRPTSRTDADGVSQTLTYLPDADQVTATTHGGAHPETETATPNPIHGRPNSYTDRNGRTTTFVRDLFGLLTEIQRPLGSSGYAGHLRFEVVNRGDATAQYFETRQRLDTRDLYLREYLDGYGRVTRVEDRGAAPEAQRRIQDFEYDFRGHVHRVSLPHHDGEAPRWIVRDFDALGRLVRAERPGVIVQSRTWLGAQRNVTDPNGNVRVETLNWREQVVQASETVSGATRTTQWSYAPAGNLVRIVDAGGAETTFSYDLRGAALSTTDSNTGTTTYTNTPAGRRQWVHRADGTHVETTYDTHGRVTKVRTSDGKEVHRVWGTDASTDSIGRVARVEEGSARTDFHYDPDGHVTLRRRTQDGYSYEASFVYAPTGTLRGAGMPGGRTLLWTLDDFGRPGTVLDDTRPLASGITYTNLDQVTGMTFGNGLVGQYTFHAVTARPESSLLATGSMMNAWYGFDGNGNLAYAWDGARTSNVWQTYAYDEANELTSETTDAGTEPYEYDAYGNLRRMGVRGYDVDAAHPQRATCVRDFGSTDSCGTGSSYAVNYDTRSNVTSRSNLTFTHDLHNRVTAISAGGVTVEGTTYDGSGGVATRTRNGVTAVHLGEWFEQYPTYHVIHVPVGRRRLASLRIPGFVGVVAMASVASPPVDVRRFEAAGLARGTALGLLFSGLFAALVTVSQRRRLRELLVTTATAAARRRTWISRRPLRAFGLVCVVLLGVLMPLIDTSLAQAETPPVQTSYYHTDLVGTATLITDDAGAVARRMDYHPYGEVRSSWSASGTEHLHHGFAASTTSEATDVSHMGARHYDAELGRFLEADDRVADVENPHQLNRYAYAGGNPVNITDPSGHGWLDALLFVFVAAVAVLTAVLTVGATVPAWIALVTVVWTAMNAAIWFSNVSVIAAGGREGCYIPIERALVVGLMVGVMVGLGAMMASLPCLAGIFHAKTTLILEGSAWVIESSIEVCHGVSHGVVTEGNHGLDDWAVRFGVFSAGALLVGTYLGGMGAIGHGAGAAAHGVATAAHHVPVWVYIAEGLFTAFTLGLSIVDIYVP